MNLEASMARLDALIEQATAIGASVPEDDAEDAAALADLAQRNRDGERGWDWQVLQRRIDAGETTMAAILSGQDPSPEAARVAEQSRANVSRVSAALEDAAQDAPDALDPRASAEELRAELERRMERARRAAGWA